jgi:hypothetical protein
LNINQPMQNARFVGQNYQTPNQPFVADSLKMSSPPGIKRFSALRRGC